MSQEQWNERYSAQEYIYGTQPNEYLRGWLGGLKPGDILFPAEGEGRNAVYAASMGWKVYAFDQSDSGRQKALRLATMYEVDIHYDLVSLDNWKPEACAYDAVAFIFVHMPEPLRRTVHHQAIKCLKPGGELILEAFTKNQFPRTSGGPKNLDLLFDPNTLISDFAGLEIIEFRELQVELSEGRLHNGLADVVRIRAKK